MPIPHPVDRATARRFLVERHMLAPPRSLPGTVDSVREVVRRLGSLQFDPLEVTGRNHDLALAARIDGYRRELTDTLLYDERWLYETYNKGLSLVPTAELPLYRIGWDVFARDHWPRTLDEHRDLVEELLARIRAEGPLSSTDVAPRRAIDWYWRPTNQVRAILEALAQAGVLGLQRREGNRRVYDLADRLFPPELLAERPDEAAQRTHKLLSRYRAHGLLPARGGQAELWYGTGRAPERYRYRDALIDAGALVPVAVEGVRGDRLVLAGEVPQLRAAEAAARAGPPLRAGVAFLAPLDPFVWDRDFLRSAFDFDYLWEVYVPAAKRRWGYYVLPLLWGDRLVGRIEPRFERATGSLVVHDVWWEAGFDPLADDAFLDALAEALEAHRAFGGMTSIALPRAARQRALVAALRPRLGARPRRVRG
ncbi:MAG: DNA glycosylase AlkZ-like family protein [Candidatus Limnocylindria bacterium]